jgi:hypothetical protein
MECAALSRFALCPHDAAVEFYDTLAHGKPQSESINFPGQLGVNAIKAVKDTLKVMRLNPFPIVTDANYNHLIMFLKSLCQTGQRLF